MRNGKTLFQMQKAEDTATTESDSNGIATRCFQLTRNGKGGADISFLAVKMHQTGKARIFMQFLVHWGCCQHRCLGQAHCFKVGSFWVFGDNTRRLRTHLQSDIALQVT